jgi:GAF domain-containing protein
MQKVAEKITRYLPSSIHLGFIFWIASGELRVRAASGYNPEGFIQGVFGQRQGIVGKAVETGEPIIFEDVQNDPRYAELSHSKGSKGIGYRFFAAVPIKAKGKSLGAIACNGRLARRLWNKRFGDGSMGDCWTPSITSISLKN